MNALWRWFLDTFGARLCAAYALEKVTDLEARLAAALAELDALKLVEAELRSTLGAAAAALEGVPGLDDVLGRVAGLLGRLEAAERPPREEGPGATS